MTPFHAPEVTVDARELSALARHLKTAAPELRKELMREVRKAAKPTLDEMRVVAARASTKVARTLTVRASYGAKGARLRFVAQGNKMPAGHEALPGLLELGSKGNRDRIRHPLFGDTEHWYSQPTHPFMRPVAKRRTPEIMRGIADAMDRVAKKL